MSAFGKVPVELVPGKVVLQEKGVKGTTDGGLKMGDSRAVPGGLRGNTVVNRTHLPLGAGGKVQGPGRPGERGGIIEQ